MAGVLPPTPPPPSPSANSFFYDGGVLGVPHIYQIMFQLVFIHDVWCFAGCVRGGVSSVRANIEVLRVALGTVAPVA